MELVNEISMSVHIEQCNVILPETRKCRYMALAILFVGVEKVQKDC